MKGMADLDAVHLGLDENEADIAEELQDFDDSFDTRSEASDSNSSDSQPSISSVSSAPSSILENLKSNTKAKVKTTKADVKKTATKRAHSPVVAHNGKTTEKKKKGSSNIAAQTLAASTDKKLQNEKTKKTEKKSTTVDAKATTVAPTAPSKADVSGSKSDISDIEDKPAPAFQSDSESENSDAGANVKRNGRKAPSKSVSPEKKINSGSNAGNSAKQNVKSYDYMTKLNYLFRDTRFFLIKSNNADNVTLSKNKGVWATLPQNDSNLNQAFKDARNVLLIYSVNESGKFTGFARMSGQSRRDIPQVAWVLPPSISSKALGGVIGLDWICRKELSFNCTSHLYNSWNEGKPVKIGRDGQEIEPKVGAELCRLFPEDDKVELTPILRKSKETAKIMREKGMRVIYKPPRILSSRGSGGRGGPGRRNFGDGGGGSGGPMRHKRLYGSSIPHRPYKLPPLNMPLGSFKRSSSPYRSGPGSGGSRAGGGDPGLPPWERYMTPAAAAEAYVADYMRTMHGQLPPLPFVPPFGPLPLPGAGPGGVMPPSGPPSLYDQLPPPARYYDGPPPLPDYPPPQSMRPPPPGFDKAPSYEDFAAWKNAGLPTVPGSMQNSFVGFSNSGLSSSNGRGGGAGSGGASFAGSGGGSGSNSYRNRDNFNRSRERGSNREYHYRGGGNVVGSSRSGGERDRHIRSSQRNYRDVRR